MSREHDVHALRLVSVPRTGGAGRLAAAVHEGVVDLAQAVLVSGAAAQVLAEERALDSASVARALVEHGAPSAAAAEEDARCFLGALDAGARAAPNGANVARAEVGAEELEQLARATLASGYRLRFRASGRSMRPWIPHGARLEVEPRPFEGLRIGDVALYSAGAHRLVAHRVLARGAGRVLARGDSSLRLDEVEPRAYLGRVRGFCAPGGKEVDLTRPWRRGLALISAPLWRAAARLASMLVVRPLRASYARPSVVRRASRALLRVASGLLLAIERLARRLRGPLDVARSALASSVEKDAERRALYERRSVQGFTSLEENLEAGLTLLEEACLTRHALAPGRALVLGCGPGRESMALARRGFEVVGIDREEGMLARARELARRAELAIDYQRQEAMEVRVAGALFDYVVVFSGLYNMILPRARRVALLARCREHLAPGGRVLVTFLSAYRAPGDLGPPGGRSFWQAASPDHEPGDQFLLNESVHIFPSGQDLADEARAAGLEVLELYRDQRAYDRAEGRVRGYAILGPGGPRGE